MHFKIQGLIIPTFRQTEVSKSCFKDVFRYVQIRFTRDEFSCQPRAAELASTAA